ALQPKATGGLLQGTGIDDVPGGQAADGEITVVPVVGMARARDVADEDHPNQFCTAPGALTIPTSFCTTRVPRLDNVSGSRLTSCSPLATALTEGHRPRRQPRRRPPGYPGRLDTLVDVSGAD